MENGADKIRINPGNIGDMDKVKAVVDVAKERNIPIDEKLAITGEVGLTGEIRAVSFIEKRIAECKKLGFTKMVIPKSNYDAIKDNIKGIEIYPVDSVRQAINIILGGNR